MLRALTFARIVAAGSTAISAATGLEIIRRFDKAQKIRERVLKTLYIKIRDLGTELSALLFGQTGTQHLYLQGPQIIALLIGEVRREGSDATVRYRSRCRVPAGC